MVFCPLFSGSSGNASIVSTKKFYIAYRCSGTGKLIESALEKININPKNIDGILITHEHSDHIKGAGIMSRKYDIPIYASRGTWNSMRNSIGKLKEDNVVELNCDIQFNDLLVKNFDIPHDCNEPKGFTLISSNVRMCIVTDLGHITPEVKTEIEKADILLLESNHDEEMVKFGPYPYVLKRRILGINGHLSNTSCGNVLAETYNGRIKRVILGHLSNTNNVPELAYETVANIINESKIKLGSEIILSVAERYEPSCYTDII